MNFVRNLRDIEANAFYLADIIESDAAERGDAALLIRKGRAFYPFFYRGRIAFSPSKFIGYRSNRLKLHLKERSARDGKDTNREIDRILGFRYIEDDRLRRALNDYCREIGVELEDHKHRFWPTQSAKRFLADKCSALDDVAGEDLGSDRPKYRKAMASAYLRDPAVRSAVLRRANGRCEYCDTVVFLKLDGSAYLETHHVISLSEQGPDRVGNVIALCANHHREAHYGKNWEELQTKFSEIIEKRSRS